MGTRNRRMPWLLTVLIAAGQTSTAQEEPAPNDREAERPVAASQEGYVLASGENVSTEFPDSVATREELRRWAAINDGRVVVDQHSLVAVVVYDFGGIGYGRVGIYRELREELELITTTKALLLPEVKVTGPGEYSIQYRVEEPLDPESIP